MTHKILIVEDNALNRKLFTDLLTAFGYETIQSVDGHDALDLLREHMPGLVIMDIQLPEISGLEITAMIKQDEALKQIPVIAVTAYVSSESEERIREAGCDDFIAKPIHVSSFLDTVGSYLN